MDRQDREQKPEGVFSPERAFGFVLRGIRRDRRISQQALADRSGYHRTYIGLLEGGQKSPSLRTIFNIARALQVKPSDIVKGVERLIERTERMTARS